MAKTEDKNTRREAELSSMVTDWSSFAEYKTAKLKDCGKEQLVQLDDIAYERLKAGRFVAFPLNKDGSLDTFRAGSRIRQGNYDSVVTVQIQKDGGLYCSEDDKKHFEEKCAAEIKDTPRVKAADIISKGMAAAFVFGAAVGVTTQKIKNDKPVSVPLLAQLRLVDGALQTMTSEPFSAKPVFVRNNGFEIRFTDKEIKALQEGQTVYKEEKFKDNTVGYLYEVSDQDALMCASERQVKNSIGIFTVRGEEKYGENSWASRMTAKQIDAYVHGSEVTPKGKSGPIRFSPVAEDLIFSKAQRQAETKTENAAQSQGEAQQQTAAKAHSRRSR